MATEITEFSDPPFQHGGYIPVRTLPPLRHLRLPLGTTLTIGQDTTILLITPEEDCRLRMTVGDGAQADPAVPDTTCMLLKANVQRDFSGRKGMKLRFA